MATLSPRRRCFILLCLAAIQISQAAVQTCMDKHQVVGVLRQMEKFLKGQEMRFTEGLRIMKSRLATLQNSVSKMPQADQSAAPTTCSPLGAPAFGTKFGSKHFVGHEVHFTCSQGYHLAGSATRVCQENGTWSGTSAICKDISECASNPCQNGGTCVEGVNQYKCTCPQRWSGSHCQHQTQTAPPEWSVVNDPAFSRRPRCAQVNQEQHCSCDAGFHMSGTSDSSICQDVNECEVYRMDQGGKLCAHECVNVPGSYRCSCPSGYKLLPDGRSCEEVPERLLDVAKSSTLKWNGIGLRPAQNRQSPVEKQCCDSHLWSNEFPQKGGWGSPHRLERARNQLRWLWAFGEDAFQTSPWDEAVGIDPEADPGNAGGITFTIQPWNAWVFYQRNWGRKQGRRWSKIPFKNAAVVSQTWIDLVLAWLVLSTY